MPPVAHDSVAGAPPTPGNPSSSTGAGPFGGPAVPGGPADPCVPDPNYKPNPAKEAFERISGDLEELKEYAGYYLAAKVDGIKQTVRNIGLYAALGVLGAIVGGAIVATAAGRRAPPPPRARSARSTPPARR